MGRQWVDLELQPAARNGRRCFKGFRQIIEIEEGLK